MKTVIVDPLTRVSGLLRIEIDIKGDKVKDARVIGNQFRGFERMFQDRPPFDIIRLAPRICGICSTHHALVATLAIEDSMKVIPDFNGKLVRDITNAFEFLQNEIRHIYFFVMPDYVKVISINPLFKTSDNKDNDYRLTDIQTKIINEHYLEAIKYSREAHKAIAVLSGKAPHCHGIWVGGTTTKIDIQQFEEVKYIISGIKDFVINKLIPDVQLISKVYSDYFSIGRGHGNLMSFGLFNEYDNPIKYSIPKVMINNVESDLNIKNINESIKSTWVVSKSENLIPGVNQPAMGFAYKEGAYSWINSPRYLGYPIEVGALARMTLAGKYKNGISVMDRIVAKSLEAKNICEIIEELISLLKLEDAEQKIWQEPVNADGVGIYEAERGSLGHWISIKNSKVSNYTVITPSAWNLSPMDGNGVKGTVEQALIGTNIKNNLAPVEIGRIVRSFDPCSNCAAHVISDKYKTMDIKIL